MSLPTKNDPAHKIAAWITIGLVAICIGVVILTPNEQPAKPAPAPPVVTTAAPVKVAPVKATPRPSRRTSRPPATDPRFDTCAEAIAAGYGDYRPGDPEYQWYRDGDDDGVVCESP
jgi:hypothetical protein